MSCNRIFPPVGVLPPGQITGGCFYQLSFYPQRAFHVAYFQLPPADVHIFIGDGVDMSLKSQHGFFHGEIHVDLYPLSGAPTISALLTSGRIQTGPSVCPQSVLASNRRNRR